MQYNDTYHKIHMKDCEKWKKCSFFISCFWIRMVFISPFVKLPTISFSSMAGRNRYVRFYRKHISQYISRLGIGWINAKFSEGGWHVYRVAPGLPGSGDGNHWEASIPKTFSPNCANLPGFVLYTYLAQLPQTDASPAP